MPFAGYFDGLHYFGTPYCTSQRNNNDLDNEVACLAYAHSEIGAYNEMCVLQVRCIPGSVSSCGLVSAGGLTCTRDVARGRRVCAKVATSLESLTGTLDVLLKIPRRLPG